MLPGRKWKTFLILVVIVLVALIVFSSKTNETTQSWAFKPTQYTPIHKHRHGTALFWFLGGSIYPNVTKDPPKLLAGQAPGDRILAQLMYKPEFTNETKTIVVLNDWDVQLGSSKFEKCPVTSCEILSYDRFKEANAILISDLIPDMVKPANQIWIVYQLESPPHTSTFIHKQAPINWTATYRTDSDLVAPYQKWIYFDAKIRQKEQNQDYSAGKSKKIAWFLSNCAPTWSSGSRRLDYSKELAKYMPVDIYGKCGPLVCPRHTEKFCSEMLRKDYKFYLAFENSNCVDYITEKFLRALTSDVIPVVMGARKQDYEKHAPQNSFIHVDDFAGPKELAEYLDLLDSNSTLYNEYFKWKGTGEFINTFFWCRLCAMLHAPLPVTFYKNYYEWWNKPDICR